MSEVNVPLLRKAVEWAEAEALKPRELREWEQGRYIIPTGMDDPNVDTSTSFFDPARIAYDRTAFGKAPECGTCYCIAGYVAHVTTDGPVAYGDAETLASEALGLDYTEAANLFMATNTIQDVRRISEEIAGERL